MMDNLNDEHEINSRWMMDMKLTAVEIATSDRSVMNDTPDLTSRH